jgi:hypothetical protein
MLHSTKSVREMKTNPFSQDDQDVSRILGKARGMRNSGVLPSIKKHAIRLLGSGRGSGFILNFCTGFLGAEPVSCEAAGLIGENTLLLIRVEAVKRRV